MHEVTKGEKAGLGGNSYRVRVVGGGGLDLMVLLLAGNGKVRSDQDLVFFNNPHAGGATLIDEQTIDVDLTAVPADVERVLVVASTEAGGTRFGDVAGLCVEIISAADQFKFTPPALEEETVLQAVAIYRRSGGWRLDPIGQGYAVGLRALATDFGIDVDDDTPDTAQAAPPAAPTPPPPPVAPPAHSAIRFEKVNVTLTKDSTTKTASIDLRKSQGDPNWVLTVGLEWDGRGAEYGPDGQVTTYGKGDLDVYFFCRNEDTGDYVVISGEKKRRGSLKKWPFVEHGGDNRGPDRRRKHAAVEQVRVLSKENGDLLVNVYQCLDNGAGAIDTFGTPRCVIRYGRAGKGGLPGADADEIVAYVGNSKNAFWATVAHIDVQDGILVVDGETRYSRPFSERMPGLDTAGNWVRKPAGGPVGRSKKRGDGLDRYSGCCPEPSSSGPSLSQRIRARTGW